MEFMIVRQDLGKRIVPKLELLLKFEGMKSIHAGYFILPQLSSF
jgi:hypothetical protein